MGWVAAITNVGLNMLEQISIGGATMNLTKVVTSKEATESPLSSLTSLTDPVDDSGFMSRKIEADGIQIRVRIYPYTTSYTMYQIGIFGNIDGGEEKLFAVLQTTDGIDILSKADFPDFAFNISMFIESSAASSITVTNVPTTALVTQAQLEEAMENVVKLTRDYYASATSVSCPFSANSKTYLVWTSGGANNGMDDATYGSIFIVSNGKYSQIKKGSGITVSIADNTFTVQSESSVAMAVIEL